MAVVLQGGFAFKNLWGCNVIRMTFLLWRNGYICMSKYGNPMRNIYGVRINGKYVWESACIQGRCDGVDFDVNG